MYFTLKVSSRSVKNHRNPDKRIPARVPYICVSNGTIGQGARHININIDDLLELMTEAGEIMPWAERMRLYEAEEKAAEEKAAAESYWPSKYLGFTADDIPF